MSIAQTLNKRFPNSGLQEAYRGELIRICEEFVASGRADSNFGSELALEESFWSRLTEALAYELIKEKKFGVRKKIGVGPDFLLNHEGRNIWVEVVCPKATGLPEEWQDIKNGAYKANSVFTVPHTEILLRWTSAIKEKIEKLHGRTDGSSVGYISQGIVEKGDSYVIAVNGCQLRRGPFPAFEGISRFPYAVEAVFPIGPLGVAIDPETRKVVDSRHQERHAIDKANGSQVPAVAFLDPSNHMVSAIWALDLFGAECVGQKDRTAVIHNPNASNPLPLGFLPAEAEFGALREDNEEYSFKQF